jgi:transposase
MHGQGNTPPAAWEEERALLREQNALLQACLARAEAQNAKLKADNASLRAAVEELQGRSQRLDEDNTALKALVEGLQRQLFGRKSEKIPPVDREIRRGSPTDLQAAAAARKKNASRRKALPERQFVHPVPEAQRTCPKCGGHDFRPVGPGKTTVVYEYVPARIERHVHVQEKLACRCGEYIVTAAGPARVVEGGSYGPGLMAHIVTEKCLDALPLYRQEKQFKRLGIPLARATLVGLFHACATVLQPLWEYLLQQIAASDLVQADETPMKMQDGKTGYLWTFLNDIMVGYKYSVSRSGATPVAVLGGGAGTIVVDAYSGYNRVFTPDGWSRAGCLAHVRRKFFDARSSAPEAELALNMILDVYRVEHEAKERGIVNTGQHLQLRQARSRPLMERFHQWLAEQQGLHPPKGPMGQAVNYALNNWEPLTRFLDDARTPVDNNASERALRVAALGRKNFLFVGHELAGQNLAGLYSLVATCEANGVNPEAYLADVLLRIQTHPSSRIEDLLPQNWNRLFGVQATTPAP